MSLDSKPLNKMSVLNKVIYKNNYKLGPCKIHPKCESLVQYSKM